MFSDRAPLPDEVFIAKKKNNPNDIYIPFGLSVFYQVEFLI